MKKLLGSRSLANRSGAGHKARRRVVGQLFSSAALARYTPSIIGLVDELADELISADGPVPLAGRMRRFAFAVIATTVLGLDSESREALFADFEIWTKALFSIPLAIPGTPFAKAMGAALFAEKITAKQADDWGMIWESVPDEQFAQQWWDRALHLAKGPTMAYGNAKKALRGTFNHDLEGQLALEAQLQGELGQSRDFKEGVLAFIEKRPAQYEGR